MGRSFGLNRQQVIRNIHEAYGRATDAFEAGQTKDLAAFFRHELDEVNLKRIKFRLDTVSLHSDSIVLQQDLRYFSDYRKLLEQHYTFVCPVNDTQEYMLISRIFVRGSSASCFICSSER